MNATASPFERAAYVPRRERALVLGLGVLAVYHLALAIFMVAGAHAFYKSIGPFDGYNPHYIRDVATYSAAIGAGLAVAVVRPAWRVPVLAVTAVQFALHTLNHLVDIGDAHPGWSGYFDFFSLLAATLLLAWMLRAALGEAERSPTSPTRGGSR
jgi:hypothetical protein